MKGVVVLVLVSLLVAAVYAEEDPDDFEESSETVACWPRGAQLIKVPKRGSVMDAARGVESL